MPYLALKMRRPSDWHVHVRQGRLLKDVVRPSIGHLHYALLMPNLNPVPVSDAMHAFHYLQEVQAGLKGLNMVNLWPTLYLTPDTDEAIIRLMYERRNGFCSVKYYPYNTTTHSGFGLRDIHDGWPVFEVMQELDVVLNVHGEVSTDDLAHAEQMFLELFMEVHEAFPGLRIVFEHVSSADAINLIMELPANVAATITAHHPCLTINDVEHDGVIDQPHHACLPRAKTEEDRQAILAAMLSVKPGDPPKIFFGSDSAPHRIEDKLKAKPNNGVYSGPVALPVLAELFEDSGLEDWPERLEQFVSIAGCKFYGVEPPQDDNYVLLSRIPWAVPEEIGGVVPFRAGQTLRWQVEDLQRQRWTG